MTDLNFEHGINVTREDGWLTIDVDEGDLDGSKISGGSTNSLTEEEVEDYVGNGFVDGLSYDDVSGEFSLDESYAATWTSQHEFSAGLDTRGDIVDNTTTIWDSVGGHIEQTALENDSVTVAGNAVALGASTAVSVNDLSDVSSGTESAGQVPIWNATNGQYENASLTGGTGIAITQGDASTTINFDASIDNDDLANSSVTIAGNSVSLGGSTTVNHSDLSNIGFGDHHAHYAQSTEPSSPTAGETWVDTATGVLYVYADYGSGLDWHPVPPVTVLEEAVTFGESGVSYSLVGDARFDQLQDHISIGADGTLADTPSLGSSGGWSGLDRGISIEPNTTLAGVSVNSPSTVKSIEFKNVTDGNTIFTLNDISISGRFDIMTKLESGKIYSLGANNPDAQLPYNSSSETSRVTSTDLDAGGMTGGSTFVGDYYVFEDPRAIVPGTTGEALITIASLPDQIRSWDLATFDGDADGETFTVDVEDDAGNVEFQDIDRNFDISAIPTTDNVLIRANFSVSGSGVPTFTYAARRYLR